MMKRYHIWTIGCQMNQADSGRVAAELDTRGYVPSADPKAADLIILNTCVVRQSAENRAVGRLQSIKPLKTEKPNLVIALMGCMVGIHPDPSLLERFPFVDVFMPPSDPTPLLTFLDGEAMQETAKALEESLTEARYAEQGLFDPVLATSEHAHESRQKPGHLQSIRHLSLQGAAPVAANVPVVYGCSHACTFCVIPLRRGAERSRPLNEVVEEVEGLVDQGVREVTLLGQIVDRYGKDFPGQRPDLADLLRSVHEVQGLQRIRFLTSHPNYMNDRILQAVAQLPKICEQIEVPVQAGSNVVLERMRRGYSREDYKSLVERIRSEIPGVAIHTDVIVGFPGETDAQFDETYDLLRELRLDKAHLAMYSPRPGTVSARRMPDDVPPDVKKRRWETLDRLQAEIVGEANRRQVGSTVEVLVEELHRGKWRGRTRTNKLVFFTDRDDWQGKVCQVRIEWAGPWSMIGKLVRTV